jgi:hypothetical protein
LLDILAEQGRNHNIMAQTTNTFVRCSIETWTIRYRIKFYIWKKQVESHRKSGSILLLDILTEYGENHNIMAQTQFFPKAICLKL